MGGDTLRYVTSEDDESCLNNDCQEFPLHHQPLLYRDDNESFSGSNGFVPRESDKVDSRISSNSVEFDGNLRRRKTAYKEIMRNYDELWTRRETLYQAKCKILRYTPGSWIVNSDGKKQSKYAIPKTTTLLLIGPKGSGKSSLINRISRVFEDDKLFASERAQVTYNSLTGDGTYFLQEYMIPRGATSFCLFDSRSLSENFADNDKTLQRWMTKGVRHGELVIRDSDSSSLTMALKCKAEHSGSPSSEIRKVNFVMFVVNGFSVLRAMNSGKKEDTRYMDMVTETFSCPYLSFKDDKPVIVVTRGDLLSLGDRARVHVYLGEKLCVPPTTQIFDIPDNSDPLTELTIVEMIKYSLEHADKSLSVFSDDSLSSKVFKISVFASIFLAILLGIACVVFPVHRSNKHSEELHTSETMNWVSKSQVNQLYEQPFEPLITAPPPNSNSKSAVKYYHEIHEPEPSSRYQNHELEPEPERTLPEKSDEATSMTTLPSKDSVNHPWSKDAKSESLSRESRHPKSAVKWHKIRHLWLHSD